MAKRSIDPEAEAIALGHPMLFQGNSYKFPSLMRQGGYGFYYDSDAIRWLRKYLKKKQSEVTMKPKRGTLEENDLTFVSLSRDGELIVEDTSGKQEVWFRHDHTPGYGLTYEGHVYEFARSRQKPNLPPGVGRVNPPRRDIRAGGRYEVNPPLIKPHFGSVSTGTLKDSDLIDAFTSELEYLYRGHRMPPDVKSLVQQGNAFGEDGDQPDDDDLTGDLQNALNDLALPYSYFGSLEGDGADFGFWPDIEQLERAVQDGEVIKVNDTGDIPAKYRGEVMVVNDHGNVTFGYMDGRHRFRELWSVV